jgi:H+-transporting ATPase
VIPNRKPDDWNLPSIYLISAVLGIIACLSSLILLFMGLDSSNSTSLLHKWGLPSVEYEEIVTMMYLKVSVLLWLML